MMLQEDICTTLGSVSSLGGRVYPNVAPDKPTTPYAVYTRVASVPTNTLADGQPIQQTRLQVDYYATSYSAVQSAALAGQAALLSAFPSMTQQLDQDLYEAEVKLHRVMHDYSVWHTQP
jgi:Protein of unknown function (DUF3168)